MEDTPSRPPRKQPTVESFLKNMGNGFQFGAYCATYHYLKHGIPALLKNVPRVSCSAAVCFGLFSAIDHAMVSARGKEEPFLDCAVAAAGASGITTLPRGIRFAGAFALIGGAIGGVTLGGLRHLEMRTGRNPRTSRR